MPRVSIIIPTARRPKLLVRAINSVLAQTMPDFEIVVVVDGPNAETIAMLYGITDERLRVIKNSTSQGPGSSRNNGVALAKATWIAFLDDDDEWLPEKLDHQLAIAEKAGHPVIVSSLSHIVTPMARYIWPRRLYDGSTLLDEYLFDRKSLFKGDTFLQPSSLLMSREIFDNFRFPALRLYEDQEFLLNAVKVGKTPLVTVPEALAIVYMEEQRESLSAIHSWRSSLKWLDKVRPLVGPRAYSGFCLTIAGPQAAIAGDYSAFFHLLYRAFRGGSPRPIQLAFYLATWLIPMQLRRRVRRATLWSRRSDSTGFVERPKGL